MSMSRQISNVNFVNSMISDKFEIYHVKDVVDNARTLYHYHDFYEIHATLSGNANFYLDGKQFEIEAGSILLIQKNDLHRIVSQSSKVFDRIYIFITPEFLRKFSTPETDLENCFKGLDTNSSKVLKVNPEKLKEYLAFVDEKETRTYGADIEYQQKLIEYIIFLNRLVLSSNFESEPINNKKSKYIDAILEYINGNLDKSLSLDEMEKQFFVSKYYISREFKKYTGLTFHQYVQKKKLLFAKKLLVQYQNSTDVYQKCGFKSYAHFLKAFKKEFQLTPKQYLEKEEKKQKVYYQND